MKSIGRGIGIALLFVLLLHGVTLLAQAESPITVTGSQPVISILETLTTASQLEVTVNSTVTGTTEGIAAFCRGEVDMVAANRPISVAEENNCTVNEQRIEYAEFLIGYDILAIIAHPELSFATCLSDANLTAIFAPSAQYQVTSWDQTQIADAVSLPLTIYLPAENTLAYALLDRRVAGFGLRSDAVIGNNDADIVQAVATTPGAIGAIHLTAGLDLSGIQVVNLRNEELGECFAPSADTVDNRQYTDANRLLVYVNRASLNNTGLTDLLSFVVGETAAPIVADAGFIAPSANASGLNQEILLGNAFGRQFSKDLVTFQMVSSVTGQLRIGGSAGLSAYMQNATDQFSSAYSGVTTDLQLDGEVAGRQRLCNSEIDALIRVRDLPEDILQSCQTNNVRLVDIDLGRRAAVILGNGQDDFLTCLTTEQVIAIWGDRLDGAPTQWNAIDATNFPEIPLILVAPATSGDSYTDLLLTPSEGLVVPIRLDAAETNADSLYRAAAIANANGTLTYMSWQEYLRVLENGQTNIKLIAIDGGNGCVTPSEESIYSGQYPYVMDFRLTFNQTALTDAGYQTFLWYLFSDANYALFESGDLLGPRFLDLPSRREELQRLYAEAATALITPPEATPEATPELTPEVTPETTPSTGG